MKKKTIIATVVTMLLMAIAIGGCGKTQEESDNQLTKDPRGLAVDGMDERVQKIIAEKFKEKAKGKKEEFSKNEVDDTSETQSEIVPVYATYIPIDNNYVFISEQSGVFTIAAQETEYEIIDIDGNVIQMSDLKEGDVVTIDSNGIMLESYPGQLAGVTKITVTGVEENLEQYKEIIDELTGNVEENIENYMNILYSTQSGSLSVLASTAPTLEDNTQLNILMWKDLIDVVLEKDTDLTLEFSEKPNEVYVTVYPSELMGTESNEEGNQVTVELIDGVAKIKNATTGLVYRVDAVYENDITITYGFYTK